MNVEKVIKLKDDEEVLGIARNHWITRLGAFALAFLLIAAPFFFMVPLLSTGKVGLLIAVVMFFIGCFVAVRVAYALYWNAFIVTTHRVIDIDQRGFFNRTVSEATYDKIQDVSFSVKGMIGALCGFGSLTLQTAGNAANLELPHVADPKVTHHLITETMSRYRGSAHQPEGGRNAKVTQLLDAATELNDAEARAFLTAIQQAVGRKEEKPAADLGWYEGADEDRLERPPGSSDPGNEDGV